MHGLILQDELEAVLEHVEIGYAKYGVTANTFMPRARTAMTMVGQTAQFFEKPEEGFDMFAPENVSPFVAWLASPSAQNVSGNVFIVWGKDITVMEPPRHGVSAHAADEEAGWTFDEKKAAKFYAELAQERADLQQELDELFPPWIVEEEFIPKVNNKTRGYVKGEPFIKRKEVQFNPNSRKHIEFCLKQKYKWKPREFTPSGDAKIDETILNALPYPEAKKLAHSFLIQKRIGMLAEGNSAWMKLAVDDPQSPRYGLLRHTINPNGTVTGRASHFGPNLAQVPATRAPYGKECRELFTVPPGYVPVGADLSGLELRCLAHFMNDGGKFAKELLEGDIHTANMAAFGVADRDQAKRLAYATLYGAGVSKLGEIVGGTGRFEGARGKVTSDFGGYDLAGPFVTGGPLFPSFGSWKGSVNGTVVFDD